MRGLSSAPRGFAARSRVLARPVLLAQTGELASRLEEAEFHKKEINAIILAEIKGEDIDITSDSDNDEDGLEVL